MIRFSSESPPECLRNCGGLPDLTSCRTIDIASYRDAGPVGEAFRTKPDPGERGGLGCIKLMVRSHPAAKECLPLLFGEELEESCHREQQRLRISVVEVSCNQKVRTDHFQAIASGSVTAQHQSRRFDRFLMTGIWLWYSLK